MTRKQQIFIRTASQLSGPFKTIGQAHIYGKENLPGYRVLMPKSQTKKGRG